MSDSGVKLVIDVRERGLIKLAEERGIAIEVENLPAGDVMIRYEDGGIIFERKAWADFRASFSDGRQREQKTRLLEWLAGERRVTSRSEAGEAGERRVTSRSEAGGGGGAGGGSGRAVIYLVEKEGVTGRGAFAFRGARPAGPAGARGVSDETLQSTLCSLAARDRLPWISVDGGEAGTMDWIQRFLRKYEKDARWLTQTRDTEDAAIRRGGQTGGARKRATAGEESGGIGLVTLTAVRGVSTAMARAILEGRGGWLAFVREVTREELPEAQARELADTKHGKRRIGPAVAARIIEEFRAGVP